ncbi:MAG: hypothetical protein J1E63_07525 [Muribaculaceae bacterium]|nr:hypothetical protein [Muribaculaceae bacterium]
MNTTQTIFQRINAIPAGVIFGYSDLNLPAVNQLAGAKALSRMVADNRLRRVGKGRFYKPATTRLGEMYPGIDEMTKDLVIKDGKYIGYITGVPAFSQLGLTTQISSKLIIGCKFYRRPIIRAGYEISFTRQENEISAQSIPLLRFLDALRSIKKIPACTPDIAVKTLLKELVSFSSEVVNALIGYSKSYPASTRAILGAMLEISKFNAEDIKENLNPLTKYRIGISSSVLPNKSNWNIV